MMSKMWVWKSSLGWCSVCTAPELRHRDAMAQARRRQAQSRKLHSKGGGTTSERRVRVPNCQCAAWSAAHIEARPSSPDFAEFIYTDQQGSFQNLQKH